MSDLIRAKLIRRYKRFLADVYLENGEQITVHCPNTGSMRNCVEEGALVWLSRSDNKKRKYQYTWEYIRTGRGHTIGINTLRANHLVRQGIESGIIRELQGYSEVRSEVVYGLENSRIDLLLSAPDQQDCYVEVKNVTLLEPPVSMGVGYFPDAVSERGSKHLRELKSMVESGNRAVLLYCVQHSGIRSVRSAGHIDSRYGDLIEEAMDAGVEVLAYKTRIRDGNSNIQKQIPFERTDVTISNRGLH